MNTPAISLTTLLERMESQIETADGRTVRLCRDLGGGYWVVDGAERVVSLNAFAAECRSVGRQFCARERRKAIGRLVVSVKQAFARAATAFRPGAPTARA
jgi:hypothetical protein